MCIGDVLNIIIVVFYQEGMVAEYVFIATPHAGVLCHMAPTHII